MVSGAAGAMAVVAVQIMEPNGLLPVDKLVSLGEISGCTEITNSCKSLRDQAYDKRVEYLFMVMILCGILQIVLGLIQAGRLVRLIPNTVMTGFVNGLAIIIFKAQLESFQEVDWKKDSKCSIRHELGKFHRQISRACSPKNFQIYRRIS